MPEWLTKQYGPFSGVTWVIIITAGAGLGLVMRQFIGPSDGGGSGGGGTASPPVPVEVAPGFIGGGTTFNQGEIVADVLEAIEAAGGSISTHPGAVISPAAIRAEIINLKAQAARLQEEWDDLKAAYPSQAASQKPYTSATLNHLKNQRLNILAQIAGLEAQLDEVD